LNKDILNEDTIAAIATPPGHGGIAIIRISGKNSLAILKNIFARSNNKSIDEIKPHRFYRGFVINKQENQVLDDVLVVYMKSPNSYTGQDIVEIRAANPGEYTLRAFLNGKMDLSQAEAVVDVINSQTEKALKQSQLQLEGQLSKKINTYKDILLDMLAEISKRTHFNI
jgi:tRNA modification GTPase